MKQKYKLIIKGFIYHTLKIYCATFGAVLYFLAKKYASLHTKLIHVLDWRFSANQPSSYKHEINLYNWIYDPSQVEFIEGLALARMYLSKGDCVLDLCCGDGSYAYLFFSDIASHIDALDYDSKQLDYAKKHYAHKNIQFIEANLLTASLACGHYDFVVWSAGVAYFSSEQRAVIFKKIYMSLKEKGGLFIKTPLEKKLLGDRPLGAQQIEVVDDKEAFELEFAPFFQIIIEKQTDNEKRVNLNYILRKKH